MLGVVGTVAALLQGRLPVTIQLVVSPNPAAPSSVVAVAGSGFPNNKTRLLLDGAGATTNIFRPRRDGTFNVGITVSSTPKTQTLQAQQSVNGSWVNAGLPVSIVVQAVVTPPPPNQVVRVASPTTSLITLQSWAVDNTLDVIEFAAGTFANFATLYLKQARTRPLLWRCQSGVIFDGGGSGTGAIHVGTNDGPGVPAQVGQMTFDFAGSTLQNYNMAKFGILMAGWVDGVIFKNAKVRNVTGLGGSFSHVVYVESDMIHRGQGVTIQDFDIVGPTTKSINGVQVYAHDTPTGTNNVHVIGGTWSNLNRFTYAYSDGIDFLVDGVTISNVNVPIEAPALPPLNQIQGIVRNTHATGSGANRWDDPLLTDGGGNSFN
jgi:hypothetical protein